MVTKMAMGLSAAKTLLLSPVNSAIPRARKNPRNSVNPAEFGKPRGIPRKGAKIGLFKFLVSMYARRTPGSERVAFQSFDSLKVFSFAFAQSVSCRQHHDMSTIASSQCLPRKLFMLLQRTVRETILNSFTRTVASCFADSVAAF